MLVGAKSDIGKIRRINQDSFYISTDDKLPIYLVADGMGGHKAGEIASNMARDIIRSNFERNIDKLNSGANIFKVLKRAIEEANTKIYLRSLQDESCRGMGTTVILCYVGTRSLYLGHVGDSRAYIIRDSKMEQLTEDHSFVNQLVKSGSLSPEEARTHPKKNMITRAVGSSSIIEIDLLREEFSRDDILLIMTDGISNMLSEDVILEEFIDSRDLQLSCENIVNKANDRGGLDNSTIVAIKFSDEVKI